MKKTILMALVSTLVIGTAASYAVEQDDMLEIEAKGPMLCPTTDGREKCGQAKAMLILEVGTVNPDGTHSGTGVGQIALRGTAVGNLGYTMSTPSDDPVSYTYDNQNRLTISGFMYDVHGNKFTFEGDTAFDLKPNNRDNIDIVLSIGDQEGEDLWEIPAKGRVIFTPIRS